MVRSSRLLKDPTVTDILINTHRRCFIERFGQLQETKVHFKDEAHLLRIINRIVSAIGRRVDESSPMVDARLRDGSRVNVAVRPIAIDGPLVSIRKFAERVFDMDRLVEVGTLAAGDGGGSRRGGRGQGFDAHRRRHRVRQDDDAQRAVEFHSRPRTPDHHRGRRRTATATAARRPAGDAPRQYRGQGRSRDSATSFATRSECAPIASSSASAAAKRRSTCCRR